MQRTLSALALNKIITFRSSNLTKQSSTTRFSQKWTQTGHGKWKPRLHLDARYDHQLLSYTLLIFLDRF
jgi:hypothetical protein